MMTKRPILVFHTRPNPPGGGQAVLAWALQTLQSDYDVTLLSWFPPQWAETNLYFGTQLDPALLRARYAPQWMRRLIALDPDPTSLQLLAFGIREARKIASRYDAVLSFDGEFDVGQRAIQYIHYPWLLVHWQAQEQSRTSARAKLSHMLRKRLRPWRLVSGLDFERIRRNVTLANSDWTGQIYQAGYHAPARTVYPPVAMSKSNVPWSERENGFVCIGRIAPEKKYERVISILQAVRARGYPVHLHLAGSFGSSPHLRAYEEKIRALVSQHREWISLEENISRGALVQLMAAHRYGIHGMTDEHFGMAMAEMVCSGGIVFIPDGAGQVEVVGHAPLLLYTSEDDAVEKITRVLDDENLQTELGMHLAARAQLFSAQRFASELRAVLTEFLSRKNQT